MKELNAYVNMQNLQGHYTVLFHSYTKRVLKNMKIKLLATDICRLLLMWEAPTK
jgi:hypothetical protein